ncbi:phosphate regulon sensor histidine kinase PhoR [Niveibacterium sp. SC-1]|uniref:phosphate regulon sensor histidine kinase PhoR n=1 Tax=Niveibacterium sp. SC-1 TaxID=3135646 RepID=UPI003120294F
MRSTAYVWSGFWGTLTIFALAALPLWPLFGLAWALGIFSLLLLGLFAFYTRNLLNLVRWTRAPIGEPVPHSMGSWDYVFSDLNRRARAGLDQRDRLEQSLARFREATSAMPDGVIMLSADSFIEWINPAAGRHFELDAKRDVGQPITNLVRQPDFVNYLSGAGTEAIVCRLSRHAGTVLSIQIVPFGEDQRMVLSRDVTKFERMETMRRDFVANVSHELKTPLTVVGGFLETIDDLLEELPPDETRRYIRLASDQAGRMQRLVEDLLELSNLETSAAASYEEPVDMSSLLAQVLDEGLAVSGGRHDIELHSDGPAALLGSRKELHSAFLNLVTNAVRYTPEGGKVALYWNVASGGGACFSVQDSGIGIALEHIPRLTERFYRVDRGRSRESGGTGLGLAIVKYALGRHQAALDIQSTPGEGSRFAASFPAERVYRPSLH